MEDRKSDAPYQLLIVKFGRMLQEARPFMRELKVPLLGCAHDDYEYLTEIR